MSDKWIIVLVIAGIILLGVIGLFLNGDFPRGTTKVDYKQAEESQSLKVEIKNIEKGILNISISKEVNDEKEEVTFDVKFDEEGNILNEEELQNLTDDESFKSEIEKAVNKCINEKLYLFDHVSQSYSSYYSKR